MLRICWFNDFKMIGFAMKYTSRKGVMEYNSWKLVRVGRMKYYEFLVTNFDG